MKGSKREEEERREEEKESKRRKQERREEERGREVETAVLYSKRVPNAGGLGKTS